MTSILKLTLVALFSFGTGAGVVTIRYEQRESALEKRFAAELDRAEQSNKDRGNALRNSNAFPGATRSPFTR